MKQICFTQRVCGKRLTNSFRKLGLKYFTRFSIVEAFSVYSGKHLKLEKIK